MKSRPKQKILPLVLGISGTSLTQQERELFIKHKILGFILFNRNIESTEQVRTLTDELKTLHADYIPLILIDQEGGRVQRISPENIGQQQYLPMENFGTIFTQDQEAGKRAIKENITQIMQELKQLGIDSPVAPVADLRHAGAHDVIGDRSFSSDPKIVAECSAIAIDAILDNGGFAVMKHIPGHGASKTDSHLDLPIIDTPLNLLQQQDFEIFKQLSVIFQNQPKLWAMTAHIIYSALDEKMPATLSSKVIKYIREEIGFEGILISDAIEMKALPKAVFGKTEFDGMDLAHIALMAYQAGCDVILHCTGEIAEMIPICSAFAEENIFITKSYE